ncbi:sensor histidine kinase [Streptomyces sp. MBT62]|uniref:sensor histidine kinase n=1 Tax=Streptomyces sp. MBT62 TaxID=2800410 RepID=UPI00190DBFB4|nr:histidine kinase [Streptomyces sp. MBT62]MBK3562983.1 sensor histidine kinase [Streptomyces sp. MBT62]
MRPDPSPPLLPRLRPGHRFALEVAGPTAYGLAAWGLPDHGTGLRLVAAAAAAVLLTAAWAAGRHCPLAAFGAALTALWLTPLAEVPPGGTLGFLALAPTAWALYLVATACRIRTAVIVLVLSLSGAVATALPDFTHRGGIVPFGLVLATAWTTGYAVRQRRGYARELLAQTIAQERLRIARELHDVVAHGMSVITVQAGYGHLVIDDSPDRARAALHVIETTGRETTTEMRRLLGVLRTEDTAPALAPAPGLADLDRLLASTAEAGVQVELVTTGNPRTLPVGIDTSAYRIVQEALTNVVKHAETSRADARIGYGPEELLIEITDQGQGPPGRMGAGHGLIGMRERAAMCGGDFQAGPLPGGGFQVRVQLPLAARDFTGSRA